MCDCSVDGANDPNAPKQDKSTARPLTPFFLPTALLVSSTHSFTLLSIRFIDPFSPLPLLPTPPTPPLPHSPQMSVQAASDAAAAVANRGNTLFLWYTSASSNNFGTLFAISTKPKSTSNTTTTLSAQPQYITFNDPNPVEPLETITSASMVSSSTSGAPSAQLHHLYLALNTPSRPFLLRLAPQSPNTGDDQDLNNSLNARSWSIMDQSQTLDINARISSIWLASGKAPGALGLAPLTEGSAIYELLASGDVGTIQKLDVSNQPLGVPVTGWPFMAKFLNNASNPKIVRLTNDPSGLQSQAFIIGGCRTFPNFTCMLFIDDKIAVVSVSHV